jgi:hypothetical protein
VSLWRPRGRGMKFGTSRREPIKERARGCGSSLPKDPKWPRRTHPASQSPYAVSKLECHAVALRLVP